MPMGVKRTPEERAELVAKVEKLVAEGWKIRKACENIGLAQPLYYTYRAESRDQDTTPVKLDGEFADLHFDVVSADEAKTWVPFRYMSGRFGAFKEGLIQQLKNLKRTEAISFPAPANADKKEITAINTACQSAVKRSGLDYAVRFSKMKHVFVIMRKNRLLGKGE